MLKRLNEYDVQETYQGKTHGIPPQKAISSVENSEFSYFCHRGKLYSLQYKPWINPLFSIAFVQTIV